MNGKLIITGASRGIGQALCVHFLEQGREVVGLARDFSAWETMPEGFTTISTDFSQRRGLPERVSQLAKDHGDADGLILCAGQGLFGAMEELSFEQMASVIDVNFLAHAFLVRAFLPLMKSREEGDVVFMSSEAAHRGGKRGAMYAASKAALDALARGLREECARSSIRITTVHPGMVRTGFYNGEPFEPGPEPEHAIEMSDLVAVVDLILRMSPGTVLDDVRLTPLKRVIAFKKRLS